MADIPSSLRRLQESIQGLSEASALGGSVGEDGSKAGESRDDISNVEQGIFDETSPLGSRPGSAATSASAGTRAKEKGRFDGFRSLPIDYSSMGPRRAGIGGYRLGDGDPRLSSKGSGSFETPLFEDPIRGGTGVRESAEVGWPVL